MPGVSRSGATISAGLFRGFDREAAARYSFLLSVPAVVLQRPVRAAQGRRRRHRRRRGGAILATAVAFIVGYASIAFLLRYLARHTMLVFVATASCSARW